MSRNTNKTICLNKDLHIALAALIDVYQMPTVNVLSPPENQKNKPCDLVLLPFSDEEKPGFLNQYGGYIQGKSPFYFSDASNQKGILYYQ
jgi:hypothetical protein